MRRAPDNFSAGTLLRDVTERTPPRKPCTTPHHPQLPLPRCPVAPRILSAGSYAQWCIAIDISSPMQPAYTHISPHSPHGVHSPHSPHDVHACCSVRILQMFMREHDKLRRMHLEHTRSAGGVGGDTAENADNSTSHTHHTSARAHTTAPLVPSRSFVQVRKDD